MNNFFSKKKSINPLNWLKYLIIGHLAICITSALSAPILLQLRIPPLSALFSLSSWGISKGYFWQVLTYLFVSPMQQIDTFFIINLVFALYFLWSVGSTLIQTKSLKDFLWLYFGSGISGACAAATFMYFFGVTGLIAGPSAALYGLLAAWMMLMPDLQILLFFTIPVRIKWLVSGVLASTLLISISQGDYTNFILYQTCIFFGYVYALLVWQRPSPFSFLHPLEKILISFGAWVARLKQKNRYYSATSYHSQKICDFQLSKSLIEDEKFMNACLSKIHLQGEKSLSFFEKWKLKKISKRMQRKQSD